MTDDKSNRLPRDERRAQLLTAALEVFTTAGVGDELLIYGNTYGNLFLIGGFLTLLLALISGKSYRN